ncbi:MAG: LAGLIDADG family homing endonuclease [Candidatus Freyarchaeota archaeon]
MRRKCRSLEERVRLYDEVMRLRRLGLGYKRIARAIEEKYGVSLNPGMICNWVKGRHHPLRRCNEIVEGPGLAYAVSAWLGDGMLVRDRRKNEYYVKLAVSDYDFAGEWGRRLAEALGRSKPYAPRWDDKYERWIVRGSSILLYGLLKRAKGDPRILLPFLEKHPAEACRGFFDAEGSVNVDYYHIVAGNTDSRIIGLFEELLGKLGVNCKTYRCRQKETFISPRTGKLYRRSNRFVVHLTILGEKNILRVAEKVGFTIARKRAALMELVRKYRGS